MRATWFTVLGLFAMLSAPNGAAAYTLKTTSDGQPVRWARPAVSLRIDPALEAAYGARAVRSAATMECERKGMVLMLLVEAYRARHGAAPESLDDLVPEYLEAVPIDPASGKGYGYRLLADDPYGRTYLLYSLGVDGEDNGGHEEAMKRWYDPSDAGVDHVINKPRATRP